MEAGIIMWGGPLTLIWGSKLRHYALIWCLQFASASVFVSECFTREIVSKCGQGENHRQSRHARDDATNHQGKNNES
eukprot:scaffold248409_cov63-Cyclotella_meneghiniana.AAC.4